MSSSQTSSQTSSTEVSQQNTAASPEGGSLFRHEALEQQQTQWLGTVLLTSPISHSLYMIFALLVSCGVLGLLFFGDYTRKETINGWLVPQQGLVQVYAPRSGVVTKLMVEEGGEVIKGANMLVISSELQTEANGGTQQEILKRLNNRLTSLTDDRLLQEEIVTQQIESLERRIAARAEERGYRIKELAVQKQRVKLANASSKRISSAQKVGIVSEQDWMEIENDRLNQLMTQRVLERDLSVADRERRMLETELAALPLSLKKELAILDRQVEELEQQLTEAESLRQIALIAPQNGTVSSLQLKIGSSVNSSVPLLSIVPTGSKLVAQLFIPTRAIGFIRAGQDVLLRYRAFPYQKFGHFKGKIISVSRSTLSQSELPEQIRTPQTTAEPVYSAKVELSSQTAIAYGDTIHLQPGMQLEADVKIENRKLIEWVLDPLYTLTGSLSR